MFRIIDSLRVKLQPFVSEMLQSVSGLPSCLIKSSRLCIPQLLFTFEAYDGFEYINSANVHFYVKQLEDQILRVLRKSRLISSINSNSLFTISTANPFVFIATQNPTIRDHRTFFFGKIFDRCNNETNENNVVNKYFSFNKCHQLFLSFFLPHVNGIFSKVCDDNIGKPHNTSLNELIKVTSFIKVLIAFKELIFAQTYFGISSEKSKNLQKIFDSLYSTLDIDSRFSDGRCNKMVMSAVTYYQENLPAHYNKETHERKLMLTLQYFTVNSRGPAIYKYIKMIQSECDKIWNNGRKMCEEISLTGNCCIHKVHRLPHDDCSKSTFENDSESTQKNISIMFHSSMAKIISACNCGRRQATREDPFSLKAANYDFYLKMKFKCHTCRHISHIKFPVYDNFDLENLSSSQNMTFKSENRDSPVIKSSNETVFSQDDAGDDIQKSEIDVDDTQAQDILSGDNLSNNDDLLESDLMENNENYIVSCSTLDKSDLAKLEGINDKEILSNDKSDFLKNELFLTQSSDNEELVDKQFSSEDEFNSDTEMNRSSGSNKNRPNFDVSTLPSMIHTLCTPNVPARFSSWSLVCLGSSSIYSHNLGIQDQQGFINGSHYLLPWNVTVMLQHAKNMPPLWEGKRPPGIKHKKTLKGFFIFL